MYTYEEQVLEATDSDGMLNQFYTNRLLHDHGTTMYHLRQDGYTGKDHDAADLLNWLGY